MNESFRRKERASIDDMLASVSDEAILLCIDLSASTLWKRQPDVLSSSARLADMARSYRTDSSATQPAKRGNPTIVAPVAVKGI